MIDHRKLTGSEIEAIGLADQLIRVFAKLGLMEAEEIGLVIDIINRNAGGTFSFEGPEEEKAFVAMRDMLKHMQALASPTIFEQRGVFPR